MASKQHDLKLYLEYQKPGEMQRVRRAMLDLSMKVLTLVLPVV